MIRVNRDGGVTAETDCPANRAFIHLHAYVNVVYARTNTYENPTCVRVSRKHNDLYLLQFESERFCDEYFADHPLADHEYVIWFGKE